MNSIGSLRPAISPSGCPLWLPCQPTGLSHACNVLPQHVCLCSHARYLLPATSDHAMPIAGRHSSSVVYETIDWVCCQWATEKIRRAEYIYGARMRELGNAEQESKRTKKQCRRGRQSEKLSRFCGKGRGAAWEGPG